MIVNVIPTPKFKREAKRLIKKYASLKGELQSLAAKLTANPTKGVKISEDTYKIRLAVKSKGKGKSGGLRIITHVFAKIVEEEDVRNVYLLAIYDKSDYESVKDSIIADRVEGVKREYNLQEQDESGDEEELESEDE